MHTFGGYYHYELQTLIGMHSWTPTITWMGGYMHVCVYVCVCVCVCVCVHMLTFSQPFQRAHNVMHVYSQE